jgi:hypothetical protein
MKFQSLGYSRRQIGPGAGEAPSECDEEGQRA